MFEKFKFSVQVYVFLRIGKIKSDHKSLAEIQDLIDFLPALMLFEITRDKIFNEKMVMKKLIRFCTNVLQSKYKETQRLNECQALFMGNSRVGKTSTIRSLFGRSFQQNSESTLFLNDIDIFSIHPEFFNWKTISKYELSVQRVNNALPTVFKYDVDPTQQLATKYKMPFEKELVTRTVMNEEFIESIKTHSYGFVSVDVFFRVYDFGGQEIFSSVHHIFMSSNALYFLVFDMNKLSINHL
eukprot:snap_masked-scaffold_10-processed-gene-8.37-mRNA-1 protein AED:1.00 eAED:1.00 QI:0/0/0/0/1/1/2/0/240